MTALCRGWYGLLRRCTLEHVSERSSWQQAPWPQGVPRPGHPAWPDGAIRWLGDTFPSSRWRLKALSDHPWMLTVTLAAQLRADIEALREQYRLTARTWGRLLPRDTAQALLTATVKEGARLQQQAYVLALEHALSPTRPEQRPEPTPSEDVGAAP